MVIKDCPHCGGEHWGSYTCPFLNVKADLPTARLEAKMDGLVPGRIVYFVFDEKSAAEVMRRRTTGLDIARRLKEGIWPCGAQAHIGNSVFKGTVAPAAVVAVHVAHPNNSVNLKVLIDWADEYWAQNVPFDSDKQPGSWHWMFDGQQKRYTPDRTA